MTSFQDIIFENHILRTTFRTTYLPVFVIGLSIKVSSHAPVKPHILVGYRWPRHQAGSLQERRASLTLPESLQFADPITLNLPKDREGFAYHT